MSKLFKIYFRWWLWKDQIDEVQGQTDALLKENQALDKKLSDRRRELHVLLQAMFIYGIWYTSNHYHLFQHEPPTSDKVKNNWVRIPTVKLKIPGKAFLKSESRTSVFTFFRGSVLAKSQPLPLVDSLGQKLQLECNRSSGFDFKCIYYQYNFS